MKINYTLKAGVGTISAPAFAFRNLLYKASIKCS